MAEEQKPLPPETKGLSVPPPPQALTQPLQEGLSVPRPSPQLIHGQLGTPVPPPTPLLLQPAAVAQPVSSGTSPQSAPPPANTAPSGTSGKE